MDLIRPGAQPPIDLIPVLKYLPERWAPWKSKCRELRTEQMALYAWLRELCEKRVREGTKTGCFLEKVIEDREKLGLEDDMIAYGNLHPMAYYGH